MQSGQHLEHNAQRQNAPTHSTPYFAITIERNFVFPYYVSPKEITRTSLRQLDEKSPDEDRPDTTATPLIVPEGTLMSPEHCGIHRVRAALESGLSNLLFSRTCPNWVKTR